MRYRISCGPLALGLCVVALGLAACNSTGNTATQALHWLTAVRLPSGSRQVTAAPIPQLRSPGTELNCYFQGGAKAQPLRAVTKDEHRFWIVPDSLQATKAFLRGHAPTGFERNYGGPGPITITSPSASIGFVLKSSGVTQLYLTLVQLAPGSVVVRADGIGVPVGAGCAGSEPGRSKIVTP